jgi:hypothetical protein
MADGRTLCVEDFHGSSYEEAAVRAAYGIFMRLSDLDEVRRRTPSYWRWTDPDALRKYYEAKEDSEDGAYLAAVEKLTAASDLEPGNSLIDLALNDNHLALAHPLPSDIVLRSNTSAVDVHFLLALRHALRAVAKQGRSYLAHDQLALTLGGVATFAQAWRDHADLRSELAPAFADPPDGSDMPATQRFFLDQANCEWRLALRRAKLPYMW